MQSQGLVSVSYLAGTILKEDQDRLRKMVFRATRGKALTYFEDILGADLKDYSGEVRMQLRTVYVLVFQDGQTVRDKLTKVCDSFS